MTLDPTFGQVNEALVIVTINSYGISDTYHMCKKLNLGELIWNSVTSLGKR